MKSNITKINVVGIGGAGCNIINGFAGKIKNINTIAIDTDIISLNLCKAGEKILSGNSFLEGKGSGGKPEIGKSAVKDSEIEIKNAINDSGIVVIVAGFGGGTGSGAFSIVAKIAKELGILTIVIFTRPLRNEEKHKFEIMLDAVNKLSENTDASLCIDNEKLINIFTNVVSLNIAYNYINDYVRSFIECISRMVNSNNTIIIDLNDLQDIFENPSKLSFGSGKSLSKEGPLIAYERAIKNEFFDDSIENATSIIVFISGDKKLRLDYISIIEGLIMRRGNENAIFYHVLNTEENEGFTVSIIAVREN
ncbi:MAG: hypothetical protein FWG89_06055 [Treponema sp.]|nr:hypothetical protein [Treponema sp.]